VALAVVSSAIFALRARVRHVLVAGHSMRPTLLPGDRLVVLRLAARPQRGQLVLTPDPRVPERMLVKRVHAVDNGRVDLRGDDPSASTDSRTFGTVPADAVAVCVVLRYHPGDRAGRVR
jgi:nickel-type superoxide dismutase maturation protease